ncbi:MAG: hypothetical protein ABIU54_14080 [Candidatus Eisenbacteria bacterium]
MLDSFSTRVLIRLAPVFVPATTLHRRALAAAAAGLFADAERCFEAGAAGYRRKLAVEPLARLRVHQCMVRARAAGDPRREAALMLEIVRGLNRLDRLEGFASPHALVDARTVLSAWLDGAALQGADSSASPAWAHEPIPTRAA